VPGTDDVPGQTLRRTLAALPSSVRDARAHVRALVPDWPTACLATLQVLVDEIVTNAVLHARSPLELVAHVDARGIRVEVADQDPRMPRTRHYGRTSTTGRGLLLVEALACRWGAEQADGGKVVWFEFRCETADD
jgi:anti-sigma regulatory factor (Ser/Thr protein kinase)